MPVTPLSCQYCCRAARLRFVADGMADFGTEKFVYVETKVTVLAKQSESLTEGCVLGAIAMTKIKCQKQKGGYRPQQARACDI